MPCALFVCGVSSPGILVVARAKTAKEFVEGLATAGKQGDIVSLSDLSRLQRMVSTGGNLWLTGFLKKGNGIRVLATLMWGRLLREP